MKTLRILALYSVVSTGILFAQTPAAQPHATVPASAAPTPSAIADAKAKGMVWVNTNTKVYHPSNDKEYGATKKGKFMTEADAKAAGFHVAKDPHAKSPAAK